MPGDEATVQELLFGQLQGLGVQEHPKDKLGAVEHKESVFDELVPLSPNLQGNQVSLKTSNCNCTYIPRI